ncbi:hypothetical protein D3C86_2119560 [compost metagenome]
MASSTFLRVLGLTAPELLMTLDTVPTATPAKLATSLMLVIEHPRTLYAIYIIITLETFQ